MKHGPVFLAGLTVIGIAVSLALAYFEWVPVDLLAAP
jgi:hypothetical protein